MLASGPQYAEYSLTFRCGGKKGENTHAGGLIEFSGNKQNKGTLVRQVHGKQRNVRF